MYRIKEIRIGIDTFSMSYIYMYYTRADTGQNHHRYKFLQNTMGNIGTSFYVQQAGIYEATMYTHLHATDTQYIYTISLLQRTDTQM